MAPRFYHLDPLTVPGAVRIVASDHPDYLAETMHTAEIFVQRLDTTGPILLPAECETTRDRRLAELAERYILDRQMAAFVAANTHIAETHVLGLV